MKTILLIGGTKFLGRHIAASALANGHRLTILNRGTCTLEEQSAAEHIVADRDQNLDVLKGRTFDAVIDTCCYRPEQLQKSLALLKGNTQNYVFISSISAYGDFSKIGMTEADPTRSTAPGAEGDYGSLKADCENLLLQEMPETSLVIRPGLIVGPYDPTDRFTYWVVRAGNAWRFPLGFRESMYGPLTYKWDEQILGPGRPDRLIQFIDVRDLSEWILLLVTGDVHGIFQATGPNRPLTMGTFLKSCLRVGGANTYCAVRWIDDQKLLDANVTPWSDLPLWIPESEMSSAGFMRMDCSKAFEQGLKLRFVTETIADTLEWANNRQSTDLVTGLTLAAEQKILLENEMPEDDPRYAWIDQEWASGEITDVDAVISFLEDDPWYFGSGYVKEWVLKKLRKISLSASQRERLVQVIVNRIDSKTGREFRRYCNLAQYLSCAELSNAVNDRVYSDDLGVRRRARWVLAALTHQPHYHESRARKFERCNNYKLVVEHLSQAIFLRSRPQEYLFNLRANAYARLGEFERAIADFNESVRLSEISANSEAFQLKEQCERALISENSPDKGV